MKQIERVALFQRMIASIREDIQNKEYEKIPGKISIIEGELSIYRMALEEKSKKKEEEKSQDIPTINDIPEEVEPIVIDVPIKD